jgi:hypothetical protein
MVQPINYLAMMPQTNIPAAIEGFGEALQARRQRIAAEDAKAQYSTDLQQVLQNPSMKAFNEFVLKYPKQREVIKDVAGRFSQEQLDSEFDVGAQIAVSLENQNPDVALNVVEKTIQARKNAGQPTTTYDQIQQILSNTEDPDRIKKAQAITNFSLSLLNPEKFGKVVDNLSKLRPEEGFRMLSAKEVADAGLPPGSYQRGPKGEIKPVGREPLVKVDLGQQRDTLALKELDVPRAKEFSDAAASARKLANDSRIISNLLKGSGGGRLIKLTTDLQRDFGFDSDRVSANDLANALATRGAVQIRAPGSGATSDLEFKSYLQAFPSLANSERGRELMATYAEAFAKRSARLADHARKLIREDRYSEEEIARFDESLGPVLGEDFYALARPGRRQGVPQFTPQGAAPAAAPPSDVRSRADAILRGQ